MVEKRRKRKGDKKKSPFSKGFRKYIRRRKSEIKKIVDLDKQTEKRKKFEKMIQEIYERFEVCKEPKSTKKNPKK